MKAEGFSALGRREDEAFATYSTEGTDAAAAILYPLLRHHARYTAFAILKRVPPDLPEDIVSHAFTHLGEFRGESSFHTWFHKIALNKCYDFARGQQRRNEPSIDNPSTGIEETAIAIDAPHVPELLPRKLLEIERWMLSLKIQGYPDKEIALKLGYSPGYVRVKLCRLRKKLRNKTIISF